MECVVFYCRSDPQTAVFIAQSLLPLLGIHPLEYLIVPFLIGRADRGIISGLVTQEEMQQVAPVPRAKDDAL